MKIAVVAFVALVGTALALNLDGPVIDEKLISEINASNGGWVAGRNEIFEGMTLREARRMLGALPYASHLPPVEFAPETSLQPNDKEFDVREKWPECADRAGNVLDQGRCGSCWAFAASETLSDRHCVASKGEVDVQLSPQHLVACDKANMGCNGGYLDKSWTFMERNGVVTDKCFPYTAGSGREGKCEVDDGTCVDESEPFVLYHAKNSADCAGAKNMEKSLKKDGSVEVGFYVYSDFMQYKSGVYYHKTGGLLGGHAVKVIGFGEEDGMDYWIIVNSWGSSWGEQGTFKMRRGTNECNCESWAIAGEAGEIEN